MFPLALPLPPNSDVFIYPHKMNIWLFFILLVLFTQTLILLQLPHAILSLDPSTSSAYTYFSIAGFSILTGLFATFDMELIPRGNQLFVNSTQILIMSVLSLLLICYDLIFLSTKAAIAFYTMTPSCSTGSLNAESLTAFLFTASKTCSLSFFVNPNQAYVTLYIGYLTDGRTHPIVPTTEQSVRNSEECRLVRTEMNEDQIEKLAKNDIEGGIELMPKAKARSVPPSDYTSQPQNQRSISTIPNRGQYKPQITEYEIIEDLD